MSDLQFIVGDVLRISDVTISRKINEANENSPDLRIIPDVGGSMKLIQLKLNEEERELLISKVAGAKNKINFYIEEDSFDDLWIEH